MSEYDNPNELPLEDAHYEVISNPGNSARMIHTPTMQVHLLNTGMFRNLKRKRRSNLGC